MRVNSLTAKLSVLLCMLLAFAVQAAEPGVVVLNASDAQAYNRATASLTQRLRQDGQPIADSFVLSKDLIDPALHQALTQATQIVAVGSKACEHAAQHTTSATITCGFITSNSFQAIQARAPERRNLTALYIDQPLQRLLNLASLLGTEQDTYRVGMLAPDTQANRSVISQAQLRHHNLKVHSSELQLDDNPVKVIEPLMINNDVLIVQPSARLFNRLVAKLILQLSLRYKVPVIGFSQKYTDAGALVSLYASPEDVGEDLADTLINPQPATNTQQMTRHGSHFSVSVNRNVARKLLAPIDAGTLEQELTAMESTTTSDSGKSSL